MSFVIESGVSKIHRVHLAPLLLDIDDYFQILDLDKDGILFPAKLRQGLNHVVAIESEVAPGEETDNVYNVIFERFGEDLVPEKFRNLIAEILTEMARGIGNLPVIMVVHNDGLIMKAAHHESELMLVMCV